MEFFNTWETAVALGIVYAIMAVVINAGGT